MSVSREGFDKVSTAKISWYAKLLSDSRYSVNPNFYAGKYSDEDPIVVDIQLWNNRWGNEDTDNLVDYDICFFFDRIEDITLLNYCTILYNEQQAIPFSVTNKKAVLEFSEKPVLSGTKNNGSSADNPDHFLQLRFIFSATGERLKDNDLKSLYFEVLER